MADNFKGALKTLEGLKALQYLPSSVTNIANLVGNLISGGDLVRGGVCLTINDTAFLNEMYELASFLEMQVAVPFFEGITDSYKTTHFSSLAIRSAFHFAAGTYYHLYFHSFDSSRSFDRNVRYALASFSEISEIVLAGSILVGAGSQLTTTVAATSGFAKGARYFCV